MTTHDKPFVIAPRCAICNHTKNHHRAFTLECPRGKRTLTGYTAFGPERFEQCEVVAV